MNIGSTNVMTSLHIVVTDDDEAEDTDSEEEHASWDDIDWDHKGTIMKLDDFMTSSAVAQGSRGVTPGNLSKVLQVSIPDAR